MQVQPKTLDKVKSSVLSPFKRSNRADTAQYAVLVVLAFITLAPIIVMFLTSFKTQVDIMADDPMWIFTPTLDNYEHIFANKFDVYLKNSIIVGLTSTALSLFVSGMAAFALVRLVFPCLLPIAFSIFIIGMVCTAVLVVYIL
jgi:multiple sugar transport system permease protein